MPLDSVSIETLKEYLDKETYLNVVKEEAIKKASSFKYRLNVFYKE